MVSAVEGCCEAIHPEDLQEYYERGVRVTRGSDRGSAVAYRGVSAPVNARFSDELAPYGRASREENDCRGFATLAPPPSTDRVTLPT